MQYVLLHVIVSGMPVYDKYQPHASALKVAAIATMTLNEAYSWGHGGGETNYCDKLSALAVGSGWRGAEEMSKPRYLCLPAKTIYVFEEKSFNGQKLSHLRERRSGHQPLHALSPSSQKQLLR